VRLTLLVVSPRVAPGLLTGRAWQALASAGRVGAVGADQAAALRSAGVAAEHVNDVDGWLGSGGEADDLVLLLEEHEADRLREQRRLPPGAVLTASYDVPGSGFVDLVRVMDRLRDECPWDREQTHRSLVRYLLEEAHEVIEAIETGDRDHLREELGDLLLQVAFHARIASEDPVGGFDVDDVARGITDKLVYRHPHVFAGLEVADADEVDRNWEALKAAEKQRTSPLDGVPTTLPALAYAEKVLGRLAKAGRPVTPRDDSVGDRLLGLVAEARAAGLDPEQELRDAVRRLLAG
jgi:XTP/dITP diphosphohydrolase